MPQRVQLSRARGWRKPPNTVSVARPGRWGNPFAVEKWGRTKAVGLFRDMTSGGWSPDWVAGMHESDAVLVYRTMANWRRRLGTGFAADFAKHELRGKNLACWCSIGELCHADVLLEIANA